MIDIYSSCNKQVRYGAGCDLNSISIFGVFFLVSHLSFFASDPLDDCYRPCDLIAFVGVGGPATSAFSPNAIHQEEEQPEPQSLLFDKSKVVKFHFASMFCF
jgi:hypothetical protein